MTEAVLLIVTLIIACLALGFSCAAFVLILCFPAGAVNGGTWLRALPHRGTPLEPPDEADFEEPIGIEQHIDRELAYVMETYPEEARKAGLSPK